MGETGLIQQMFSTAFGLAIAGGLMSLIFKRHSIDWAELERVYGREWRAPAEARSLQTMTLYSEGRPAKSYKGLLTIGLYPDGVGLHVIRLLAPFHEPLFIPYTDIRGWKQNWYLDAAASELELAGAPHMKLIMPADQAAWIAAASDGRVVMSEDRPPHGNWPWATFWSALVFGAMAVSLIALLAARHLG